MTIDSLIRGLIDKERANLEKLSNVLAAKCNYEASRLLEIEAALTEVRNARALNYDTLNEKLRDTINTLTALNERFPK